MSLASEPSESVRSASRVRLVPLNDLVQQVDNEDEFRVWIFDRVARGECNIYWRVLWPLCAFFDRRDEVSFSLRARPDTDPDMWKERPDVRFVRLTTRDAQQFKNLDVVSVVSFRDGLFVPEDVAANTGLLEAINFSGKVRVSDPSRPAPETPIDSAYHSKQDAIKVLLTELYVEDSVRDDIRDHFDDSPSQEITPFMLACGLKPGWNSKTSRGVEVKPRQADVTSPSVETVPVAAPPQSDSKHASEGDPYQLQGRCDGVYMLYLIAKRCSMDPKFVSASKSSERKELARKAFARLLNEMAEGGDDQRIRKSKLSDLFRKTRLNYALRLIDPQFNHELGREKEQLEWPTPQGKALLAQPDTRRQAFVTDMLRLIMGGAEYWLDIRATRPANGGTNGAALQQWLEDHGLTGVEELKTAFAAITWNGQTFQIPPKFAKQPTSRGRTAGARRASRRRT